MVLQPFHAQYALRQLEDATVVGNKVCNMFAKNAGLLDHKEEKMGEVIGLIRVMPSEVISDEKLQKMIEDIKKIIKPPARLGRINIKDIAFGLRGLDVTVLIPDSDGALETIVELITKVKNVDSAEVTDVGRI